MNSSSVEPGSIDYHVHISRAESWNESDEHPIPLDEWIRFVERDPEMRFADPPPHLDRLNETPATERNGLACWIGWSRHKPEGPAVWFAYHNGRITVANPDHEVVRRMYWIAGNLDAQVQGDRGEVYDVFGEPIPVLDDDYKPGVFDFFRKFSWFGYPLLLFMG